MKEKLPYLFAFFLLLLTTCDMRRAEDALVFRISAEDFKPEDEASAHLVRKNVFNANDRVGVFIWDESGAISSKNLPYKYDGTEWVFDGASDKKTQAYYEPESSRCIIYYPYNDVADRITDASDAVARLKALFAPQEDQSNEIAYLESDLMIWESDEAPLRIVDATLRHAYASFSLLPTARWRLADGNFLDYAPPTLQIHITDKNQGELPCFREKDGSYCYILPENYTGEIHWSYIFGGKKYVGSRIIQDYVANTRYSRVETIDLGLYTLDKAQVGDFYCRADNGKGYLIPEEATSIIRAETPVIGIVFHTGRYMDKNDPANNDISDYSKPLVQGVRIPDNHVNGYVVALTDVHNTNRDGLNWEWKPMGDQVGISDRFVGASYNSSDWNGYANCLKMHEFVRNPKNTGWKIEYFPAAYACEQYGNRMTDRNGDATKFYDWQSRYVAPSNSSGWFLPSYGQLKRVYGMNKRTRLLSRKIREVRRVISDDSKPFVRWFNNTFYSTSSEYSGGREDAWALDFEHGFGSGYHKSDYLNVRAVCVF